MSDPQQISPKEAADLGAQSLTLYGKLFFPRTFRQASPAFHEDIGAALYSPARLNAFKVFRDGAKTTLLRAYKSQRIAYGISHTVMYVSVSQQHSMFSVRWLRRQVMYNKRWTQTFGIRQGAKWTDEHCEIIHENLPKNEDESPAIITVLAMGITGQVRGFNPDDYRPDLIIIDDILNEENTATPEQRKKIEDLLFGAILNSLAPASEAPLAKAAFLQTPFNREDAIEKCIADPEWNGRTFGILDYSSGQPRSRWEERYPTEGVLASKEAHIRRSQYRLWMREKECQLVSGEEKAIDVSRFKFYDVLPERLDVVVSFDPASSAEEGADEFAIAAVGFRGEDVFLLDYGCANKNDPGDALNIGFNLSILYKARKWLIESVAFQKVMAWVARQEMIKRKQYYITDEFKVGKWSNADRIMQSIPGLAAFGHFWVRPSHTKFISQADDYTPGAKDPLDDLLTAVANAIVDQNPALKQLTGDSDDGRALDYQDESQYEELEIGDCP